MKKYFFNLFILLFVSAYLTLNSAKAEQSSNFNSNKEKTMNVAILSGGCFWGMEELLRKLPGVVSSEVGYTGGTTKNATYDLVKTGKTGHAESVKITFDPNKLKYSDILFYFFKIHDPTTKNQQGNDIGNQYRSSIYYLNDQQRQIAEEVIDIVNNSHAWKKTLTTELVKASDFWTAEEYHQKYLQKNPNGYTCHYERNLNFLTPEQFEVTKRNGTEEPFNNAFWNNHNDGIYVDIISGEPLFSSKDKFDSGTGWPSFTKPINNEVIMEKTDKSHGMIRTEVRSKKSDSHLGHVFNDGPGENHLRYCINSASLRFIPKDKLNEEGYEKYKAEFSKH